ncbi:MAG: Trk system potassium transporter TrkA [Roseovarius sp.]|nr:Trk system potassium transporter TrkA [Roseovarius sp.]
MLANFHEMHLMKVLVCGVGQVGWQIAKHLSKEGNDVKVVDVNADLVRKATDTLDVQGVAGFASYPEVMRQAGAHDIDMIIAATSSDEVNLVTCQLAYSVFGIRYKVARLREQTYLNALDLYRSDHRPIDMVISPELEVSDAVLMRLDIPHAFDSKMLMDGKAQLLGLRLDAECPILNTPLYQLNELLPDDLTVMAVAIRRKGHLYAADASDQLFEDDEVYIFAAIGDVSRVMDLFGKKTQKMERIVIVGGGHIGLGIAKKIESESRRVRVKIIESDRVTAENAAETLDRTIVLNGNALDIAILKEAGVDRADALVAVTDDDKSNMLSSVRARTFGCPYTVSLINDPTLSQLMAPLGIDSYIDPKAITVGGILRRVRHGNVKSVYLIGDAEAEVMEVVVESESPIDGMAIKDIDFPEGALIGGIMRGQNIVKPYGDLRIASGDRLVIFALNDDVPKVEQHILKSAI